MSGRKTGRNSKVSTKGLSQDPRLAGYSTAFKYIWRVYVQTCLRTGREWALSPDEFMSLVTAHCHYCGSPPSNRTKLAEMKAQMTYNGIDRVDNGQGYLATNVVTCCKPCNAMKSALSQDAFIQHARRIIEHQDRLSQVARAAGSLQPSKGSAGEGQDGAVGLDPVALRGGHFDIRPG